MISKPDDRPVLPFDVQPSVDDWCVLLTCHPNLLLIGPDPATDAALLTLTPQLRQPVCCHRGSAPLTLPTTDEGTLILREVAALEAHQQQLLLRWLDQSRMQVVSVTSERLFSQVERGAFLEGLYYRLNALVLEVGLSHYTTSPVLDKARGAPAVLDLAAVWPPPANNSRNKCLMDPGPAASERRQTRAKARARSVSE